MLPGLDINWRDWEQIQKIAKCFVISLLLIKEKNQGSRQEVVAVMIMEWVEDIVACERELNLSLKLRRKTRTSLIVYPVAAAKTKFRHLSEWG
jgi:hypothetical protein